MSKYKLTKTKKTWLGITLYQIQATADFGDVEKGELGGWIEKEENLNQEGNAWVYGNALVFGDAWVYGNARIFGDARVYGNARVFGDAWVYGELKLSLGYFFGLRYQKEEIKYIPINDGYELIAKGDIKVDTEPELDDKTQEAMEVLKRAGYRIVKGDE